MSPNPKLFISYAHEDSRMADQIERLCQEIGIQCFLDRKDIHWGESITKAVGNGLDEATHVVLIVSPASLKSMWVPFEIGFAFGTGKQVLPVLTHPSLDLPGYLGDPAHKTGIEDLEESLRSHLLQKPVPPKSDRREQDETDWIESLYRELRTPKASVENRELSPHDAFMAVFKSLLTGVPAELFGNWVAANLNVGTPNHYVGTESTPEPFDKLLAPLVTADLVRVRKRVSGVRVVLFSTDRGQKYGRAFL